MAAPELIFWTVGASKNEKLSSCNKHEISSEFIRPNMIQKRFLSITNKPFQGYTLPILMHFNVWSRTLVTWSVSVNIMLCSRSNLDRFRFMRPASVPVKKYSFEF